jgi:hypothetical protein
VVGLIKSSALLHQYQRPRDGHNRIIAAREDYDIVYGLRHLISQSVSPAPDHLVAFLHAVKKLTKVQGAQVTYPTRDLVMQHLEVSDESIKRYVRACRENEWIEATGKGQKQTLRVIDLPHPISPVPHPRDIFGTADPVTDTAKTQTGQASAQVTPAVTGDDRIEPGVGMGDTESGLDDYVRYAKELFAVSGKEQ